MTHQAQHSNSKPARVGWRHVWVAIGALVVAAPMVAMAMPAANAASAVVMPQRLADQLANCRDDLAAAKTAHAQAWAQDCVSAAAAAIAAWQKANPTPKPTPTATATASPSPTVPPTTTPPTPTPTPTPPPAGVGSFANGPSGGVGPASGTVLKTLSGQVQANTTYDGYALTAANLPDNTAVSGLTLRNCTMPGRTFSGSNLAITHCRITGGLSFSGSDHVTFSGNDVIGFVDDALHITSDSGPASDYTVSGNWIHARGSGIDCAAHLDGVQILGVAGASFMGNVIDLGHWISCSSDPGDGPLNGAFQIEVTQGPVSLVTIDANLLNGGGMIVRVYSGCTDVHVTNNGFGDDFQFAPGDTLYGQLGFVWSGNFIVSTNAPAPRT